MKENSNKKRASAIFGVALCTLSLALTGVIQARAQRGQAQVVSNAVVNKPIHFDVSPPLRDLAVQVSPPEQVRLIHPPLRPMLNKLQGAAQQGASARSAAIQASPSAPIVPATIGLSFDGVGENATNNCPSVSGFLVAPSDSNAAVGDTQVVQWVNLCFAVFDKSSGALLAGPFPGNHFWAGFGGQCERFNDGDPIIQLDKANHVWVASQNIYSPGLLRQ